MTTKRSDTGPEPLPRRSERGVSPRVARALLLVIWLLSGMGFVFLADPGTMDRLTLATLAIAVFMPAIVISLALLVAAATWSLSRETHHLQGAIDELRRAVLQRDTADAPMSPVAQSRLEDLKAAQDKTDSTLTMFFSQRARNRADVMANSGPEPDQPWLQLDADHSPSNALPPAADLIRALNFPENEADSEGFASLRLALSNPRLQPLIRAAQDILTRLAQEGIYMDDLRPDRARPEFWRAFAQGTRGTLIAPLGGIRDRSCLAITSGRMRSDPEFRSAVHLFLREFDRVFASFEPEADDAQITALADTRSARAFMLLGRVAGVFSR